MNRKRGYLPVSLVALAWLLLHSSRQAALGTGAWPGHRGEVPSPQDEDWVAEALQPPCGSPFMQFRRTASCRPPPLLSPLSSHGLRYHLVVRAGPFLSRLTPAPSVCGKSFPQNVFKRILQQVVLSESASCLFLFELWKYYGILQQPRTPVTGPLMAVLWN